MNFTARHSVITACMLAFLHRAHAIADIRCTHIERLLIMSKNAKMTWRKSSYSGANGNCVEFAVADGNRVAVRNSRVPDGEVLLFDRGELGAFLAGAKNGEFDDDARMTRPRC